MGVHVSSTEPLLTINVMERSGTRFRLLVVTANILHCYGNCFICNNIQPELNFETALIYIYIYSFIHTVRISVDDTQKIH